MKALSSEIKATQNPALGATILWQFAVGYSEGHPARGSLPLPLAFVILPVILHEPTLEIVQSTNAASGLRKFAAKFGDSKVAKQDLLLGMQSRALRWRGMSRDALAFALKCRLVALQKASVIPLSTTAPKLGIANEVGGLLKAATKVGRWCGALTLHEVSANLRITF